MQGPEHKRIQEFRLGAAQKRNVQTCGHMFRQLILQFFQPFSQKLKKKIEYLLGSKCRFLSAWDCKTTNPEKILWL